MLNQDKRHPINNLSFFYALPAYSLIIILLLSPLFLNLNKDRIASQFIGSYYYHSVKISDFLHARGGFPSRVDDISYPEGGFITYAGLAQLFTTGFLTFFFNITAAVNLTVFLYLLINCFFSYLLAAYWVNDKLTSFTAGLISGFSPFIYSIIFNGHYENLGVAFIPAYILFLIKYFDSGKLRYAVPAIMFYLLIFMSSPYYTFVALVFLFLFTLYYLFIAVKAGFRASNAKLIILMYLFTLCASIPCLQYYSYESVKQLDASEVLGHPANSSLTYNALIHFREHMPQVDFCATLKNYFTVENYPASIRTSGIGNIQIYYIGWLSILFLVAGPLMNNGRRGILLYISLLTYWLLSFGLFLYVNDTTPLTITKQLPVYMPFYFLTRISHFLGFYDILAKIHNKCRFTYMIYLFSGIITASVLSKALNPEKSLNGPIRFLNDSPGMDAPGLQAL